MRIEEQPYDDRHNTPPRAGGYATMREAANAGRVTPGAQALREAREAGPMDRFAEIGKPGQWGKAVDIVPNMGALTTREYDVVLNPDEDIENVMLDLTANAEVHATGLHPLMWCQLAPKGQWPRVRVQGELGRVLAFEEELNSQPVQQRFMVPNGWIKRYLDDYRTDVEWLRVAWLPSSEPAPKGCDMAGCEHGFRTRWAIAYRVPCEGSHTPMDRELFVYCQQTVMADNDVATFVPEGK